MSGTQIHLEQGMESRPVFFSALEQSSKPGVSSEVRIIKISRPSRDPFCLQRLGDTNVMNKICRRNRNNG